MTGDLLIALDEFQDAVRVTHMLSLGHHDSPGLVTCS